ncbi:MAG TPA: urea ABC transporter permease subunit UrtC [Nocardia sp.]|uniref:urea ABC transporter permease subunit UrtC n=1 Tax=Nocardia TaxID=1817 RepID=UPI002455F19C|nr:MULTISPECIES: urea ABC transporter permease subunit UrtC [Nocardia]HLS79598.1 urea ABC transporter permease subunit UrtC [Nocardia sp.]
MTSLIGSVRDRLGGSGRESSSLTVLAGFAVAAILLFAVAPAVLSDFRLNLLAKFLCFAIVAVGIGLAWGRGGMLTLGQGVFFGLGAYIMAMHMQLADAARMKQDVPGFMQIAGIRELPTLWQPFASAPVTIIAILVLPGLVAAVLGYGVFKRRVKGAYFAILSQALAAAMAILLTGQQMLGGFTGLSDFRAFFGFKLSDPANRQMLFFIAAGTLLVVVAIARQLMHSRYGELLVAVRDQEERVRFLGYDPANVKILAYVVAAFFAGIAGALFTPIVGIISPADIGIVPSIAFLIGVAIGGRTTLLGPVLGAIGVAWAQTSLSEQFPSGWTYLQGILFIVVVGFIPAGLAGIWPMAKGFVQTRLSTPTGPDAPAAAAAGKPAPAAGNGAARADADTTGGDAADPAKNESDDTTPDEEQKVESR